ncbi:MAG: hypothetical protein Q8O91_08730 [Candidatus Aminicenantes bacterium]|nr:hypothetical protein [Candidatus Aminicenantes bacterium]
MKTKNKKIPWIAVLWAGIALSAAWAQKPAAPPDSVRKAIHKNCAVSGCHQGQYAPMNLSFEPDKFPASALNVPSREKPELKILDAAAPEKSYLLMKIRGDREIEGKRMPLNGTPLKSAEFKAFQDWILSLKGRSPEGPAPSAADDTQKKNFLSPRSGERG